MKVRKWRAKGNSTSSPLQRYTWLLNLTQQNNQNYLFSKQKQKDPTFFLVSCLQSLDTNVILHQWEQQSIQCWNSFTVSYHITICKPVSSLYFNITKSNVKQWDTRQPCQNDCQQFRKDIDQTEIWYLDALVTIQFFTIWVSIFSPFSYILLPRFSLH